MDSRLENLSVQILQGLLAGRPSSFRLGDMEESKVYVKSAIQLAEILIAECEKVEKNRRFYGR